MRVIIKNDYDECSLWAANYVAFKIKGFSADQNTTVCFGAADRFDAARDVSAPDRDGKRRKKYFGLRDLPLQQTFPQLLQKYGTLFALPKRLGKHNPQTAKRAVFHGIAFFIVAYSFIASSLSSGKQNAQ